MRKIIFIVIIFSFSLFLLSQNKNKEREKKNKEDSKKGEKVFHIKQEVVVTANLRKSDTFDTSASSHVEDYRVIREKIPYNVGDLFKNMVGVNVSETGPNSIRPVIRGLYDERVLVLLNGMRLSEERSGGNHTLSIDPLQVKRIEVVEGPDSVVYGSNAIGGVINFIPYFPDEYEGERLSFKSGGSVIFNSNNGGKCERVFWECGKKDFGIRVSEIFKDTGNYKTPALKVKNSFCEYYEGNVSLYGKLKGSEFRAYFYQMQGDFGIPNRTAIESYFKGNKHRFFSLDLKHEFKSNFWRDLDFKFSIQKHNRHMHILNPLGKEKNLDLEIFLNKRTIEARGNVSFLLGTHNLFIVGTSYFKEDANSRRDRFEINTYNGEIEILPIPGVIPPSEREGEGIFIQDNIFITDRFHIKTGVRFDNVSAKTEFLVGHPVKPTDISNNTYSGSLGVVYGISENLNLVFNMGRAFRAPTLLERFFYGPHQDTVNIGNPDLKPEVSFNVDFGYKYNGEKIYSEFSIFRNRVDDFIEKIRTGNVDPESGMEIETWRNVATGLLRGFDFDFEYYFKDNLFLFQKISYVKGRDMAKKQYLSDIPPMKINVGLKYRDLNLSEKIKLGGEVNMKCFLKQKNIAPFERTTPGYTLFNIYLNSKIGKNLNVNLALENITDKRYHNHLSRINWIDDGMGRSLKVSLNYSFRSQM